MKTIRLLFLFAVLASAFYACSDDDPIQNDVTTNKSIALRTALNEIKKSNGISNRANFCFDFVFPISYSFNTGTTVTVTSFEGLLEILSNENPNLFLQGVSFPFDVVQQNQTNSIESEAEFTALLDSCGFDSWNDELETSMCFDIVFPVNINQSGETVSIESYSEFQNYIGIAVNSGVEIVFPVSVAYNGQIVAINNLYEFYEMINNCDSCVCSQDYSPVCVQTINGVMEYGNMCFAMCAGFTQNDVVPCNSNVECTISNLQITLGECNADSTYELTLNFDHDELPNTVFQVVGNSGNLIGTYTISQLPLTIPNFPGANVPTDFMSIIIEGSTNCVTSNQWNVPSCGCDCPSEGPAVCVVSASETLQFPNECYAICAGFSPSQFGLCDQAPYNFGQLLGTCFTINYPVQIMHQGAAITANVDGQVLQYWNPANAPMPAFVYPLTISLQGIEFVVTSQTEFETAISNVCN